MNIWSMTTIQFPPPIGLPSRNPMWSLNYALRIVLMWWVMMVAMMLPATLYNIAKIYSASATAILIFVSGYIVPWLGFSAVATGFQFFAEQAGWIHPMYMWSTNKLFSGTLLVTASIYQFLPESAISWGDRKLKRPTEIRFLDGLCYGANCVASTAPIMLVLFAVGVINLYWIIGLTVVFVVELLFLNKIIFRRIGALFVLLALTTAFL